jgi:hypothetical protein
MPIRMRTTIQNSAKLVTLTSDLNRKSKRVRRTSHNRVLRRRLLSTTITQPMKPQAKSIIVQEMIEIKAGWKTGFLKTT